MGNTVRREPVNFDIPASPNYKFLNITNFRGLDVSSNPFELATNTASDCLNVYVDETNTLTTRPRLCKKEFKNANGEFIVPLGGTCIGVYNLHNGYLLHHIIDDKPIMRLFVDGVLKDPVSGDIPTTHCTHFEHGEDIYLLTGEDYLVIKDNMISKVEGYIPNKSITTLKGEEIEDEPLNILSDEYTTKYFWDGASKPNVREGYEELKFDYYIKQTYDLTGFEPIAAYNNKTLLGFLQEDLVIVHFTETQQDKVIELTGLKKANLGTVIASQTTYAFWSYYNGLLRYYGKVNDKWHKSAFLPLPNLYTPTWKISPNGTYLLASNNSNFELFSSSVTDEDETTTINHISYGTLNLPQTNVFALSDVSIWAVTFDDTSDYSAPYTMTIRQMTLSQLGLWTEFDKIDVDSNTWGFLKVTSQNEYLSYQSVSEFFTYKYGNVASKKIQKYIFPHKQEFEIKINDDGFTWAKPSIWLTTDDPHIYTMKDADNINNMYGIPVFPSGKFGGNYRNTFVSFYRNNYFFWRRSYETPLLYTWNESTEPLITTRFKITNNNDNNGVNKRQQLFKSDLYVRFDNNYWFAKDNKYFRSAKNDPTYFPITEYSELGDSNDMITGFNIANDTTLLVYKTDRLYLIQPYTSSLDTREYAITESKNTVGNTAVDAPIVTTLTEIPLQINYDGIYGLSQLQNVSAVERIADLMSEPINDRWLNEDDKVIRKAKTLNRLYWTYIILPYESVTKIYLLDNRTNSWYYWELPIKLLEAFAKDNRAEFVDTEGNIYYLTTTDIKNAGFDTQLVTEYYDDGKKLINWFWQSQILPMGTMNYAKRLVNTTFILTDTDTQDGYGLKYNFKVFRKLASSTPEKEINDELNLVRSTTKKTNISKFGFIQLKISNITEESQGTEAEKAYRNNKLRLVGLGLKYVLLEGLIR